MISAAIARKNTENFWDKSQSPSRFIEQINDFILDKSIEGEYYIEVDVSDMTARKSSFRAPIWKEKYKSIELILEKLGYTTKLIQTPINGRILLLISW